MYDLKNDGSTCWHVKQRWVICMNVCMIWWSLCCYSFIRVILCARHRKAVWQHWGTAAAWVTLNSTQREICNTDLSGCPDTVWLCWQTAAKIKQHVTAERSHKTLSGGTRGKTRLTFAEEAARETVSKYNRKSTQKHRENHHSVNSFRNLVGIINNKFNPPYFNPAGSRSQLDHTTQTSAIETRAFTAPQH